MKRLFEQKGAAAATADLREQWAQRSIRPRDLDFGRLFCECFGYGEFAACRSGEQMANDVFARNLQEAAGAVGTSMFLNVAGQFMYQTVMDAYTAEPGVFSDLIPEKDASTLDGEKIPGLNAIGDEADVRYEGDPYKQVAFGENWIFTPSIKDRGMILALTWEAVFNDKTGQINDNGSKLGEFFKIRREKLGIDCLIDENTTDHRYNWRGTVIASYGDNSGSHSWDNLAASNALVDWTDLDAAEQVFNALTDPFTGEPITFEPKHLIVTKQLEQTARRILSATEIRVHSGGYATSGDLTQTNAPNPYANKYELKTSRLLAARLGTDTSWFLGDVSRYAKCMMAEKMNVVQAPPNSHDEFHRRIVAQSRVNERFAYVVVEPRAVVKSTA